MAGILRVAEDYSRSSDLPKARKPADGEPSETEQVALADSQGTTKHPRDVVKLKTSTAIL
jgi:hypothetical protein